MILSKKYEFLFLATTKTGSSSIHEKLIYEDGSAQEHFGNNTLGRYGFHINADDTNYMSVKNNLNLENYFKFCFVRNPFDRIVSSYKYRCKTLELWSKKINVFGEVQKKEDAWITHCKKILLKDDNTKKSFTEFILAKKLERPQYPYAFLKNGKKYVNFVGKFETIQTDYDYICDKVKINKSQLPHKNKTNHKHYTEYYNNETRKIVEDVYSCDLNYFGYKFG